MNNFEQTQNSTAFIYNKTANIIYKKLQTIYLMLYKRW